MDYWVEVMQDDVYAIAVDGWKAEPAPVIEKDKKGKDKVKGWACDLVPKPLIVARYFAKEQADLDRMTADLEAASAKLAELEEEHGGEEGAFSELDKVNKVGVAARLKELKAEKASKEEIAPFAEWLRLSEEEADLKKQIRDAEAALDALAKARYATLTEADIKTLVVDDKWLAALDSAIHGEMDCVSQALTQRVKELAERYEVPLPLLTSAVAELEAKVGSHLGRMGFRP